MIDGFWLPGLFYSGHPEGHENGCASQNCLPRRGAGYGGVMGANNLSNLSRCALR